MSKSEQGVDLYNIADIHNRSSIDISRRLAEKIIVRTCDKKISPQTAGTLFGQITKEFLNDAFYRLGHLRPGNWEFSTSQKRGISSFDQYDHIAQLEQVLNENADLKATFGGDYIITPDITIARLPATEDEINQEEIIIDYDEKISILTPLRAHNFSSPRKILHASISCKWTMRSDRAQNTRTEALNLIRLRKGKTPLISAVTMEPLPTRIASLALGTGDIDCTYHAALNELIEAVNESGNIDQAEMLQVMVDGRRLRDISDLPFDLII